MRILLFRGNFSWDGSNTYNGLIAWCHIHKYDTLLSIQNAAKKISIRMNLKEDVILIPFGCLDERSTTMNFDDAKNLFEEFKIKFPKAISMPFSESKEIHLNVASKQFVGFLEIYPTNDSKYNDQEHKPYFC